MDIPFLPSPPTDNLYKFMAILGAWTLLILAVFLMGVDYLAFKSKEEAQQTIAYYRAAHNVQLIQDRLAAIQAGRLNDAIVPGSSPHDGSNSERTRLQNGLQNNQDYVTRHQDDAYRDDAQTDWQILSAIHGLYYILVLGGVGIFCLIPGFYRWWRIQRVSDDLLDSQLKFQKMTNQKLQLKLDAVNQPPPPPVPPSA